MVVNFCLPPSVPANFLSISKLAKVAEVAKVAGVSMPKPSQHTGIDEGNTDHLTFVVR
jgi:hypothetical protein